VVQLNCTSLDFRVLRTELFANFLLGNYLNVMSTFASTGAFELDTGSLG